MCHRALDCARDFRARIAALPRTGDADAIRFGLALHVGEVMYGNIGGGNRLDFTCIGPAVNLAARLEKVAAKLGEAVVASAEFAGHCPGQFRSLRRATRWQALPHRNLFSVWPIDLGLRGRASIGGAIAQSYM